jgi:hypothetical protein
MTRIDPSLALPDPFSPGTVVVLTLTSPREKLWGALISVSGTGITFAGIDLNSFDDFIRILKSGEPASVTTLFFPMHRVERIEVDSPNGGLQSMGERFEAATGARIEALIGIVSRTTVKQ